MNLSNIRNMIANGKSIYDMPLKVCIYARVSTEHIEQKQSLINQVEHFKNYILSNKNWIFVNSYIDTHTSSANITHCIHNYWLYQYMEIILCELVWNLRSMFSEGIQRMIMWGYWWF